MSRAGCHLCLVPDIVSCPFPAHPIKPPPYYVCILFRQLRAARPVRELASWPRGTDQQGNCFAGFMAPAFFFFFFFFFFAGVRPKGREKSYGGGMVGRHGMAWYGMGRRCHVVGNGEWPESVCALGHRPIPSCLSKLVDRGLGALLPVLVCCHSVCVCACVRVCVCMCLTDGQYVTVRVQQSGRRAMQAWYER
ncbi:hypothetical protein LZ31DRAFT_246933 [Colletotrichum somersetense]|nr:hypothetical protein LZ31DRAFT_246933 [Colletotrichum somersetense]